MYILCHYTRHLMWHFSLKLLPSRSWRRRRRSGRSSEKGGKEEKIKQKEKKEKEINERKKRETWPAFQRATPPLARGPCIRSCEANSDGRFLAYTKVIWSNRVSPFPPALSWSSDLRCRLRSQLRSLGCQHSQRAFWHQRSQNESQGLKVKTIWSWQFLFVRSTVAMSGHQNNTILLKEYCHLM